MLISVAELDFGFWTKGKVAADPNNIPPSFLKSLGPLALQGLLSIFNSSSSLAHCPRIWRVATIILQLKAGKSPSEVASFCPISLTSCVDKLLECIFADRLYYIAETTTCPVDSKPVFVKVGAVKIRLLKQSKQSKIAFNNNRLNAPY